MKQILSILFICVLAGCSANDEVVATQPPKPTAQIDPVSPLNPTGTNPYGATPLINTISELSNYCPRVQTKLGANIHRIFAPEKDNETENETESESEIETAETELLYQGTITKISRQCLYRNKSLDIKIGVLARVIIGSGGKTGTANMPIRIVIQKPKCIYIDKTFSSKVNFGKGESIRHLQFVSDVLTIPAPQQTDISLYVGFDNAFITFPDLPKC